MSDGQANAAAPEAKPGKQQDGQSGQPDKLAGEQGKQGALPGKQVSEQSKQGSQQDKQEPSSRAPMPSELEASYPFIVWFDIQMQNMHDDLLRRRFFDVPQVDHFDPCRRSKFFDALVSADDTDPHCVFRVNPNKNQVECELSTGCGEFFRPEDVEVNLKDRNLEVIARREMKANDNYTLREVRRVLTVPETADVEKLTAEMSSNGRILLAAPLLKPIEKKSNKPEEIKINKK